MIINKSMTCPHR